MAGHRWEDLCSDPSPHATTPGTLLRAAHSASQRDPEELHLDLSDGDTRHLVATLIRRCLKDLNATPFPAAVEPVVRRINDEAPLLSPCTRAYVLAASIDAACADLIRHEFETRPTLEVIDGDLIPLPQAQLMAGYEEAHGARPRMGPRRERRALGISPTPEFPPQFVAFRYPAGCPFKVEVVVDHADQLDRALGQLPACATVLPLGPGDRRTHGTQTPDGASFGFGPEDEVHARNRTDELLARAATAGASVAVVPELNGCTDWAPTVAPRLVFAGSQHKEVDSKRRNRAQLFLDGDVVAVHDKLQPFGGGGSSQPLPPEAIDPGTRLTLVYSRRWTVATLICADVNPDVVPELLRNSYANLVLVSSLTPKIGYFKTSLDDVSLRNQGLVVWANDPVSSSSVPTTLFCFPGETVQSRSETDVPPGLRHTRWKQDGSGSESAWEAVRQ
jgi:hypothetical protein